ncbi:cbb3-type cytochrome c oxidase subunit I [Aureimonas jatrophae]|uniref:Cytochrome o ubiquinol oxidase subunit 1 n=1 Tax=Aureimonas jatrophae TaxID=1166073 RepID=A0A1H0JAW4_9HYPH|nr:cbb3-type cytochrome c oxidase subunit I [Aureimonas jatrophae]MBB3951508.1 cytochrome o ubiquinol oxidase subunit 1 [Aureimonas jatrophae]SDO40690.1 cytochrome o ubiquinol oxidase subunit 1 [Aureimonas jatrophae]
MPTTEGWWPLVLGRLSYDALPFYSGIATAAASLVVVGAITVAALLTWLGRWGWLWREWLTSLDHKKIGIMYVVIAMVMLSRAVIEGSLMRAQQAIAFDNPGYLEPEHFAQLFSTHGSIMVFFMAMPFLTGIINFALPMQIGAREVSFPLLNSISLWLTAGGAGLMMVSLVIGKFSTGGWSGYPPYTDATYNPGVGPDYWIFAVTLGSLASTMTGINVAVTIYKKRCGGMNPFRMPLFCWTALCTSVLMIFAMPPLTVATGLLALDRYLGAHFFTNDGGGNMMNFANLFWLFGHPEVYILILPAFGVYSQVISNFSSKILYGYDSLIIATMCIAVLSFTVWVHHFFTMGQSADLNAVFGVATMTIGIPTGVKIFDWILTMSWGRVRFTVPMLYALAFMVLFTIGGLTGILLANPAIDFQVHNSVFLVAHFHNMLIPGLLYGMIAAYTYWFPKAFGFRLDEWWGRVAFGCWVTGFCLAFLPLYPLGLMGMPRRTQEFFEPAYLPFTIVAGIGALFLLAALASLVVQLVVSIRRRASLAVPGGDPWNGRTLEWGIPCPAPEYNFAVLPIVDARDAFHAAKENGTAYPTHRFYSDIEVPKNSMTGVVFGISLAAAAFGLVWYIWWLAALGVLTAVGAVVARSFVLDTMRIIPAEEVRHQDQAWLALVRTLPCTDRAAETMPENQGLAEAAAA